jgi:hypothetical protein
MNWRLPTLLLAAAAAAFGQANFGWDYSGVGPYYSVNQAWTYLNGWTVTGDITFVNYGQAIWPNTVSGTNPNDYEINTTLPLGAPGGTYYHFLRVGTSNSITVQLTVPSTWQSGGAVPITVTQCTSSG